MRLLEEREFRRDPLKDQRELKLYLIAPFTPQIQQIIVECLLCARYCSGTRETIVSKTHRLLSWILFGKKRDNKSKADLITIMKK